MADDKLMQNVLDELRWDPKIEEKNILISLHEGAVTATGKVSTYPEIMAAGEAICRVWGVKALANELSVDLPDTEQRNDCDIASAIAQVLEHNASIPENGVKAEVRAGVVMLKGHVDWQHQREQIQKQITHVAGVCGISNQIELTGRVAPSDVKEQIENALNRNAKLEAQHISVSINAGTVTLEGVVKAFYERNMVEAAVWAAPGVHAVIDKIRVGDD